MQQVPGVRFHDGHTIPQLGFGVWQIPDPEAERAVTEAPAAGYRSIDTAAIYGNEAGVGRALAASGIPRSELFVTTKLWNKDQGTDSARRAFDESLKKLGLDYVDLYLIHWPAPKRGLYVETWQTLVELQKEGRVRSIGVSNFGPDELRTITEKSGVRPVLNQIELHPRFQQREHQAYHREHGIVTEAWSPLGQGKLLEHEAVVAVAKAHGKSAAQVLLRWHLQHGLVVIPKSATPSRIRENFAVLDFELNAEQMRALDALDAADGRIGPDPQTATF